MIGGLLVSQVLTLYTTPVIYLYFDRLSAWLGRVTGIGQPAPRELPLLVPSPGTPGEG